MWARHSDFLPKSTQYGRREKKSNFAVETWQTLPEARRSRTTSGVINHVDSRYPWYRVIRVALYHGGLPQNTVPQSNHKKNIRQIPTEVHSGKYLTSTPVKVIKNQGSLRNFYSQEEPKETGWLHVTWDPGIKIGAFGKKMKKSEKVEILVHNNVLTWSY